MAWWLDDSALLHVKAARSCIVLFGLTFPAFDPRAWPLITIYRVPESAILRMDKIVALNPLIASMGTFQSTPSPSKHAIQTAEHHRKALRKFCTERAFQYGAYDGSKQAAYHDP